MCKRLNGTSYWLFSYNFLDAWDRNVASGFLSKKNGPLTALSHNSAFPPGMAANKILRMVRLYHVHKDHPEARFANRLCKGRKTVDKTCVGVT